MGQAGVTFTAALPNSLAPAATVADDAGGSPVVPAPHVSVILHTIEHYRVNIASRTISVAQLNAAVQYMQQQASQPHTNAVRTVIYHVLSNAIALSATIPAFVHARLACPSSLL